MFFGRQLEKEIFLRLLSSEKRGRFLHFVGHGGFGKTSLLQELADIARDRAALAVYLDLGFVTRPLELLGKVTETLLRRHEGALPGYLRLRERYQRIEEKLAQTSSLGAAAVLDLSKLSELLPGHGAARQDVDLSRPPCDVTVLYEALGLDDGDFFRNPLPVMTRAFLEDLADTPGRCPVVIMFDRTEKVGGDVRDWLTCDLIPQLDGALLVSAGRDDIFLTWTLPRAPTVHELKPLATLDALSYLANLGIQDRAAQERIVQSSRGIPLAMGLAAEAASPGEVLSAGGMLDSYVVDRMIDMFLGGLSPPHRRILQKLAVLRWFNRETLQHLRLEDGEAMRWMLTRRFVMPLSHGSAIHDSVRDFVLRDLQRQEPDVYRRLHTEASEYYKGKARFSSEGDKYFFEWLYHFVSADPVAGFEEVRKHFRTAALAITPDFCKAVVDVAREAGAAGRIEKLWLEFYEGAIKRQRFDFSGAYEVYQKISGAPDLAADLELKGELLFQMSVALWYLCRFEEAIAIARKSHDLNDRKPEFRNRSLGIVGLSLDRLGRFAEAIGVVEQMVTQAGDKDPVSEAYGLNSVGYFSWHAGDWVRAGQALSLCWRKWISLKNKMGECYPTGHLGLLFIGVRQYRLAEEMLAIAKGLCEHTANVEMLSKTLQNYSEFHRRTGAVDQARQCAEGALELSKRVLKHPYYQADSSRLLGEALLAGGDMAGAQRAVAAGLEYLHGTAAEYLRLRLEALRAAIDAETLLRHGGSDSGVLERRLRSLADTCSGAEFHNVAANVALTALRLAVGMDEGDVGEIFSRGAKSALRYNWYVGMDFLESVQRLTTVQGEKPRQLLQALAAGFPTPRLKELYGAPEAHVLLIFRESDLLRASSFWEGVVQKGRVAEWAVDAGRPRQTGLPPKATSGLVVQNVAGTNTPPAAERPHSVIESLIASIDCEDKPLWRVKLKEPELVTGLPPSAPVPAPTVGKPTPRVIISDSGLNLAMESGGSRFTFEKKENFLVKSFALQVYRGYPHEPVPFETLHGAIDDCPDDHTKASPNLRTAIKKLNEKIARELGQPPSGAKHIVLTKGVGYHLAKGPTWEISANLRTEFAKTNYHQPVNPQVTAESTPNRGDKLQARSRHDHASDKAKKERYEE